MGATTEPEDIQPLQRFRSPFDRSIVTIETQHDEVTGARFVLWRHIQRTFDNVNLVRAGDTAVQFMVDNTFEDLSPLRIKHYPNVVLDVLVTDENSIRSPFKVHTKQADDDHIYYGSIICLRHIAYGAYVSTSSCNYQSGSHQFEVHGSQTQKPRREDWWQVIAPLNSEYEQDVLCGRKIQFGDRFRLLHTVEHHWLHSHDKKAPSSDRQEVSNYGAVNHSNNDDNWIAGLVKGEGDHWRASHIVYFSHEQTAKYLNCCYTTFGKDREVSCVDKLGDNTKWRTCFS